jgi:CheY-like chemotaxis protein
VSIAPRLPHVLVAEDNVLVADAMRLLFEETGHRVTTTASIGATDAQPDTIG